MKNLLIAGFLFSINTIANAAIIDFNSVSLSGATSYTEQGVTFSTPSGTFSTMTGNNGTTSLLADVPQESFRADIAGGATRVSVDLGDFGIDIDNLFLSIFDNNDNLVGTTSLICCGKNETFTLSLSATFIKYALFGSTGVFNNSVFADNFEFDEYAGSLSQVPVPAALFLFGPALIGFLGFRRKIRA